MKKLELILLALLPLQISLGQQDDFPVIEITPDSLSESLFTGGSSIQPLTIANNGDSELEFEISIEYTTNEEYLNYAIEFDGEDDFISVPVLSPIQNNSISQFTFECWVYFNAVTWYAHQIIEGHTSSGEIFFETNGNSDNIMAFLISDDEGSNHEVNSNPLDFSTWHHIAGTYDGTLHKLYVNGILQDSYDWYNTFTLISGVTLGKDYENDIQYLNGVLDDIRIWDIARTQTEIQNNMNWELMGMETGLIAYWKLNEGSGSTAYDYSPNTNSGTLTNDPAWVVSDAPIMPRQWLAVEPGSGQLGPGTLMTLDVNFNATGLQGGAYDANIIISSNDPQNPEVVIPVHLDVTAAPDIITSTDTITFEGSFVGDSSIYPLTISNIGFELLEIGEISCADPEFVNDTSDFILDPGESYAVNITFSPVEEQAYESTLTINSNDPDHPIYTIPLLGDGILPPVIAIDPDSLSDILFAGKSSTHSLSISNTGFSDLTWEVTMNNTGFNTITFTKEDYANWTFPENQDCITDNVCITRANTQGIFNAYSESSFSSSISPEDTEWAFGYSAQLQPENYETWGNAVSWNPPSMVGQPMSVHLISDNIYFDILFHTWTSGGNGGGFSYTRTSLLPPWFVLSQHDGSIAADSSLQLDAIFNSSYMDAGMHDGQIMISSNDPLNPLVTIPVHMEVMDAPSIYASEDTLDFGQMFVGDSDTLQLLVENPGTMDLMIFNVEAYPTEYTVFPPFASIDPGETELFQVIFSTDSVADFPGTLSFSTNDPLTPDYLIILAGEGVEAPIISVLPDSLSVDLFSGQSITQPFTITNSGGSDLAFDIFYENIEQDFALEFDGYDDYILVNDSESLDLTTSMTLEAWIYLYEINQYRSIISKWNDDTEEHAYLFKVWWNGQLSFELSEVYSNDLLHLFSNSYLPVNQWVHVAATYDNEAEIARLFINGVEDAAVAATGIIKTCLSDLMIGAVTSWGIDQEFLGKMDEVRIWNIARSGEEIHDNMDKEISVAETGLVAYWRLNEGDGQVAYDQTSNENHGSLFNEPEWTTITPLLAPAWLSANQGSGIVAANTFMDMEAIFNADNMLGGDYAAQISILSNDPLSPEVDIPVQLHVIGAPSIATDLDTLDCGQAYIYFSDSVYLSVKNVGSDELIITDVVAEPAAFSISPTQANITWGQSAMFTVYFSPVLTQDYDGTLTFFSNDPFQDEYQVHIMGEGIDPPVISVSQDSLFQQLAPNDTASQTLTINNSGLNVLHFEISPQPNRSLDYDGDNDYCRIPNSPSLNIGTNTVTLELWVRLNELPSQINESFAGIYGSYEDCYIIYEDKYNQEIRFKITDNTGTNQRPGIPQDSLEVDVWYHIAGVYNGEEKEAYIYLNGELIDTHMHAGLWDPVQGGQEATFGSGGGYENFFSGTIDEGRVWSVARTQEEIKAFMLHEITGNEPGLVANWRFNEGGGFTAFDRSPNNNHGTLNNNVQWLNSGAPLDGAWLTVIPDSGSCLQGTTVDLNLTFSSEDLDPGDYMCNLKVISNDPAIPILVVPIHLQVTDLVGVPIRQLTDENPGPDRILDIYPNPCSGSATLKYQIEDRTGRPDRQGVVIVEMFEISGLKIAELLNEGQVAGIHELEIDLSSLPPGVYYCVLRTNSTREGHAAKLIKL